MNYLITGAAGFIGTNLTKRLLEQGHTVHGVDNFITGRQENIPRDGNLTLEFCDIEDYCYYSYDPFDRVINLACPASPIAYQNSPFQTIKACTDGVLNMMRAAQSCKARFLHASTSEVYGDPTQHPQTEEYLGNVNCYGPRACYDEGKRLAETLIWEFRRINQDFNSRIVRIFNTYGPFMASYDGRVVSNFIVQALKGEPITIQGNGSQTRSFCYIDDLLDVMLLVLEGDYDKPLNIGNPNEFTVLELAQVVKEVTGSKSELKFIDLPGDDPKQRRPDISKVKCLYDWEPKVQLREGIAKTAAYFEDILK